MKSIDTNILLHAFNVDSQSNAPALEWLRSIRADQDVAISEFILAEFYVLLRNPVVLQTPLNQTEAADVIQVYRRHPRWRLLGFPGESRAIHDELWNLAQSPNFAARRIYDARAALTMTSQGVTEFATVNLKDFEGLGFKKVWNPLKP
jgi:predicted nucleic acid-binding protein